MHLRPLAPLAVALILATVACSSDASTRLDAANDTTTTAEPVVTLPAIPAGTTLRIGDQLEYIETVLAVAGEDQDLDYEVEYAGFIGGPPMLQAFQGGALDAGFVASTPLLFAQAGDQDVVGVAGWAGEGGYGGVLTVDDDVEGWADVAGKRVAYQRGTSAEAAVLQGLASVGLTPADITTVDVPIIQVTAALSGGSADVGVSTEPLIGNYVAENPAARVIDRPSAITDRASFLVASRAALDDAAVSAALADYVTRLVRAFRWINDHPEEVTQSIFAERYHVDVERATELRELHGTTSFITLPDGIVEEQQALADLFLDVGQLPTRLDVAREFDGRFNGLISNELIGNELIGHEAGA